MSEQTFQLPCRIHLSGQTAVVTGGSGVIGGMFCRALAACGASVAVLGRSMEKANAVVQQIREDGGTAKAFSVNVLDKDSLLAARQDILAAFGHINILVNCAGGAVKSAMVPQDQFADRQEGELDFFSIDAENIHREFDLNVYGTILPTQVLGEALVGQTNACIVNIASMGAYQPLTRIPGYSASKAAVKNFTEWAATYFARSGIRVNAIAPGFLQTTQNHHLQFNDDGTPTPRTGKILAGTPMNRFGEPSELVAALLYLVSPQGTSFTTGVTLPVDGGFHVYSGV